MRPSRGQYRSHTPTAASSLRTRAEREPSSRDTDSSVHTQSPARRTCCRGRAETPSEFCRCRPFFLLLQTYFLKSEKKPTFWYFKPTLIFFVVRHFTRLAPCHDVTLYIMTHRGSRSIPTVHQCPSGVAVGSLFMRPNRLQRSTRTAHFPRGSGAEFSGKNTSTRNRLSITFFTNTQER